jgi:spermidine synthase
MDAIPMNARQHPDVTMSEHDGVRYLHLDSPWIQGAMKVDDPHGIELAYVQRMMAWMLWRGAGAWAGKRAVQLGLGAGAITRFSLLRMQMLTTVVEINPAVIAANHRWFKLPKRHDRLTIVTGDARAFVDDRAHAGCADVLCVDLYDQEAAAPVLDDEAFYVACKRVLARGGLMSVNLFGRRAAFHQSAQLLAELFGTDNLWQLTPTREGNTILVASKGTPLPDRDTLTPRAAALEKQYGLPARKWLRMVRPWGQA